MPAENILNRATVGDDIPSKVPLPAQLILKQELIGARGLAVDGVIGAHHRPGLAFNYGGAEDGFVSVELVVPAHIHIGKVTGRLGSAVHVVVLGSGDRAVVARVVALNSSDKGDAHAGIEKWVLAIGFLPASPARVAKDVEIRRPEIETAHDAVVSGAHILKVLDASFNADIDRHGVNPRKIEAGGEANRLGKLRYALVNNAMKRFAPPVVGGNVEPRNGLGIVHQLRGLFLERHAVDQVCGALFGRKSGIHIRKFRSVLRNGGAGHRDDQGGERGQRKSSAMFHFYPRDLKFLSMQVDFA